jgi:hypothetical protein
MLGNRVLSVESKINTYFLGFDGLYYLRLINACYGGGAGLSQSLSSSKDLD